MSYDTHPLMQLIKFSISQILLSKTYNLATPLFLRSIRSTCKKWLGYTIPILQPLYTFIPLVSPLKKDDDMDGFNLGEDNQIKSITIKNGKLRFEVRKGARSFIA